MFSQSTKLLESLFSMSSSTECVSVAVVVSVLNIYSFNLRPGYNVFTMQSKHDTTEGGEKAQPEYL